MRSDALPPFAVALLMLGASGCSAAASSPEATGTAAAASTTVAAATLQAMGHLRYLNWFDVVTRGDITAACSDTEGRMAAGGAMTLVRYGANTKALDDVPWSPGGGASVFATGAFRLVHGSVGNGYRGVEGASVALDHYAVGNARAACPGPWASPEGAINGALTCGARGFPAASFLAAMDGASAALVSAMAAATPATPRRRAGALGVDELVFEPTGGPDAYYVVSVADLTEHWVLADGARYFIEVRGAGAAGSVALTPKYGVEGDAYGLLHLPYATAVRIGRTPGEQSRLALTVLAPHAATTFDYDILDGGLYVASLDANPGRLPAAAWSACAPGTWQPGFPTGRTQSTSGGQINHWPFTRAYPDSSFPGQPLR